MFDNMTPEEFADLIRGMLDIRLRSLAPQILAAMDARDAKQVEQLAALRAELDALRGRVRTMEGERRKAEALSTEAERCELVRREARAAESRLSGRQ